MLERGNAALALNHAQGLPVRVIRGANGDPTFSPATGYRFDGLFDVADYWQETGKSGFQIWRFRLVKRGSASASVAGPGARGGPQPRATGTPR